MRRGLAAVFVTCALFPACGAEDGPTPVAFDRDSDSRSVYAGALRDAYQSLHCTRFVVDPIARLVWSPAEVRDRLPEVEPETLADYARQTDNAPLPRDLDLGRPIDWFGKPDWNRLDPPASWPGFDAKFPDSGGWFIFSPVGFSTDGTEALVHIQRNGGPRDAEGTLVLLDRKHGRWVVRKKAHTTVS